MPTPIRPIQDDNKREQSMDYSFLSTYFDSNPQINAGKKTVMAGNNDASLLYRIWNGGNQSGNGQIDISECKMSSNDVMRLKSLGFITGGVDSVKFTERGRLVITTMALGEPNKFQRDAQEKSYHEILASMDKRGKRGYRIPKFAANNTNQIDVRNI